MRACRLLIMLKTEWHRSIYLRNGRAERGLWLIERLRASGKGARRTWSASEQVQPSIALIIRARTFSLVELTIRPLPSVRDRSFLCASSRLVVIHANDLIGSSTVSLEQQKLVLLVTVGLQRCHTAISSAYGDVDSGSNVNYWFLNSISYILNCTCVQCAYSNSEAFRDWYVLDTYSSPYCLPCNMFLSEHALNDVGHA